MRRFLPILMVVAAVTALGVLMARADGGVTITTQFRGTPQHDEPVIFNTGTVTLTLTGVSSLDALDQGQVTVRKDGGATYKLPNLWQPTGAQTWQWVQTIPFGVAELYIDTAEPINWAGFGPWVANSQQKGVVLTQKATYIQLFVSGPNYRDWEGQFDPTWDWKLQASPATLWAADQWPWWDEVVIKIDTSCEGHGTNHRGTFVWQPEGMHVDVTFGNGVYRHWLREPLVDVPWRVGTPTWEQSGITQGPTCWTSRTSLPFVMR